MVYGLGKPIAHEIRESLDNQWNRLVKQRKKQLGKGISSWLWQGLYRDLWQHLLNQLLGHLTDYPE